MSRFIYEGDLNGARQRQLDFISEVLESEGFKGSEVIMEPVGNAGDNYMANVKRIIVKENGDTIKMIVKLAPENPLLREKTNVGRLFQNEHFMYTEVFPKFNQTQQSAGIPENEQFKFAKCYGSLNEAPNEVIVLEDLKERHFDILNRFEPLTDRNVKLVLKNFAIYHALSFAVSYQEPETYARFKDKLAPMLDLDVWNDDAAQYLTYLEKQALEVTDDRYKPAIKCAFGNLPKLDAKIRKLAKESKYTVIQQGDGWTNNIMFRFENDNALECILVDYQMVKENSPAYDIMYMLFNSTTHKQRLQSFQESIDYYHSELDKALSNFGLKANLLYPRDRLDADLKMYGKLMFGTAIVIASVLSKSTKEAEQMKEVMETTVTMDEMDVDKKLDMILSKDKSSLDMFKNRVEDLADSFREFGLL